MVQMFLIAILVLRTGGEPNLTQRKEPPANTYRSPSCDWLLGATFRWKLVNGWRITTNAESANYRSRYMEFTLTRFNPSTRQVEKRPGIFNFWTSTRLRTIGIVPPPAASRVKAGSAWFPAKNLKRDQLEFVQPIAGTDRNLYVQIMGAPPSEIPFWKAELASIRIFPKPVANTKRVKH